MSQSLTIPLRTANGSIEDKHADLAFILLNLGHFIIKRNKRGNITAAIRKQRQSTIPLTRTGEHYRQALDSGRTVSALRGTPGAIGAVIL